MLVTLFAVAPEDAVPDKGADVGLPGDPLAPPPAPAASAPVLGSTLTVVLLFAALAHALPLTAGG